MDSLIYYVAESLCDLGGEPPPFRWAKDVRSGIGIGFGWNHIVPGRFRKDRAWRQTSMWPREKERSVCFVPCAINSPCAGSDDLDFSKKRSSPGSAIIPGS